MAPTAEVEEIDKSMFAVLLFDKLIAEIVEDTLRDFPVLHPEMQMYVPTVDVYRHFSEERSIETYSRNLYEKKSQLYRDFFSEPGKTLKASKFRIYRWLCVVLMLGSVTMFAGATFTTLPRFPLTSSAFAALVVAAYLGPQLRTVVSFVHSVESDPVGSFDHLVDHRDGTFRRRYAKVKAFLV